MVATMRMSVEHGVTHWLAGMEPRLNRMLERFGLQLTPIGPEIEYHGIRRPYLGRVCDVMQNAYYTNRPVWDLLSDRGRLYTRPTTHSP
jgi:N-acyl amino acid synthase of PEP-CTERM/exosortase system